jgi:hypothetical protein
MSPMQASGVCPKPFTGIEDQCLGEVYEGRSRLSTCDKKRIMDLIWLKVKKQLEKEYALHSFLHDLVCLVVWISLQVPGVTYKTCIRGEYVAIPNLLDLVRIYKFL